MTLFWLELSLKTSFFFIGMSIPGDEIDTPHFLQWKKRKREEKRLRERKSFLEQQMRRH